MEPLCSHCQLLDIPTLVRQDSTSNRRWTERSRAFGSLADVLERSKHCKLCAFFVHYLKTLGGESFTRDIANRRFSVSRESSWKDYLKFAGYEQYYRDGLTVPAEATEFNGKRNSGLLLNYPTLSPPDRLILPVHNAASPAQDQQYYARIRQPHRIDFDLARSWLRLCKDTHGEKCRNPTYFRPEFPVDLRLIDIQSRAVVPAPTGAEYIALSYVWGGSQPVASAADLQKLPWVLPHPNEISKTVHHAMLVTAELGLRYLWVDALCLAQEPPTNPDKSFQLAQMDRIYSQAAVSILASSCTSALSGIPGVEYRCIREDVITVDGLELVISPPSVEADIGGGVWNTRGWTYQERMLTKRALLLGTEQAYWMCQCDFWCESIVAEPPSDLKSFTPPPGPDGLQPPARPVSLSLAAYNSYDADEQNLVEGYVKLAQEYTARKLGAPSDGLNAITGVFNTLAQTHPSFFRVMRHGLPEFCFDLAVLWTPVGCSARPDIQDKYPGIPSWSWAGWFNGVSEGVQWDVSLYWDGRPRIQLGVEWFLVDGQGNSHPIARQEQQISTYSALARPPMPCALAQDYPYRHPPAIPEVLRLRLREDYYLHFLTTTSTSFHLGERCEWVDQRNLANQLRDLIASGESVPTDTPKPRSIDPYKICGADGSFCGTIALSPEEAHSLRTSAEILRLVFISYTSSFEFGIWTGDPGYNHQMGEWPIANVMWVKRLEDGTVERLQLARVLVDAWIAAQPEAEWIVLG